MDSEDFRLLNRQMRMALDFKGKFGPSEISRFQ